MSIKRSYSVLEIKRLLIASEKTPLSAKTKGHAIQKHQQIPEIDLIMRQIDKPKLKVSAFAQGTRISDQIVCSQNTSKTLGIAVR